MPYIGQFKNYRSRPKTAPVSAKRALSTVNAAKRLQRFYRKRKQANLFKRCLQNNNYINVVFTTTTDWTADGSGNVVEGVTNDPSGLLQWGTYAAIWDTYKVRKIVVDYVPYAPYTTAHSYVLKIIDQDESPTIDTEAKALEYQGVEILSTSLPFRRVLLPSSTNQKWEWRDVTSTTGQCSMKWVSEAKHGASAVVGYIIVRYYITFRGSKL